jgi:ABC-type Fe3+-siderophore transport system permease subunit
LKIILLLFMALIELIFHKGKINNTKQIAWWEMYILSNIDEGKVQILIEFSFTFFFE